MKEYLKNVDEKKIDIMFETKKAYDRGKLTLDEARKKLKEEVGVIKAHELAFVEQKLKDFEGEDSTCKEKIQEMLIVFEEILIKSELDLPEGHPIDSYLKENEKLRKLTNKLRLLLEKEYIKNQYLEIYDDLNMIRIHYTRKQMQLYSLLEKKGFNRPTTIMWQLDDYIRDEVSKAFELLTEDKEEEFLKMQPVIIDDILDLMSKEEEVLYPTAIKLISEDEFQEMCLGDDEIGYFMIAPNTAYRKNHKKSAVTDDFSKELQALLNKYQFKNDEVFDVSEGKLTLDQINLIFRHLPVDITFVDENDLVKFYSDTEHRVFPRSKGIIGREVRNCHPKNSVHIVEEIIEKFKSGKENTAEFWINKPGAFIYIKYIAVKDREGKFKGILEMMQDCTHIRSLEDSRTLLTWSEEN